MKRYPGSNYTPYVPRNLMPNSKTAINGATLKQQKYIKKKGSTFWLCVGGFAGATVGFSLGGSLGAIAGGILGALMGRG